MDENFHLTAEPDTEWAGRVAAWCVAILMVGGALALAIMMVGGAFVLARSF